MEEISATEAARRFSELLDEVEHRGSSFVIRRNGKPIARVAPVGRPNGKAVLDFLAKHRPDPDWAREIEEVRKLLYIEERNWTG